MLVISIPLAHPQVPCPAAAPTTPLAVQSLWKKSRTRIVMVMAKGVAFCLKGAQVLFYSFKKLLHQLFYFPVRKTEAEKETFHTHTTHVISTLGLSQAHLHKPQIWIILMRLCSHWAELGWSKYSIQELHHFNAKENDNQISVLPKHLGKTMESLMGDNAFIGTTWTHVCHDQ